MPVVTPRQNLSGRSASPAYNGLTRARVVYGLVVFLCAVFIIRAFYLQVIRHDYYTKAALNYQLKEYLVPAERGIILARNGSGTTPLVLNEVKFTLFADPVYVKDYEAAALKLSSIIGVDSGQLLEKLKTPETRYVVLAKKLDRNQADQVAKAEIKGVGTREESYRTYPQGTLASQAIGFVNDEGHGQYGVEQFLDEKLSGEAGELKAITDAKGVPLVSNPDNVIKEAKPGESVVLSMDIGLQQRIEELLKQGLDRAQSTSGSLVIMDPNNGQIKAMANYPTYDPGKIEEVKDLGVLANQATNSPLEVGSIMKVLTTATAINENVVSASTAFYDKGYVEVGDKKITDTHHSEGTQTVESLLVESLNTGAVWLLTQIGKGGINDRARFTWYDYMTKHYFLGQATGVEQAGEAAGYIPKPDDEGQGIDVIYANTSFGQGMSATPVQMAAALSSVINGGTYYKPTVIEAYRDKRGHETAVEPKPVKEDVVNDSTSNDIKNLMQSVARINIPSAIRNGYSVGGKTGTAEIAKPEGGYYTDRFNGTYLGFVGGNQPEYVIAVAVREPKIKGYAGSQAAAPIFSDVVNMLVDNFGVTPKS